MSDVAANDISIQNMTVERGEATLVIDNNNKNKLKV